MITLGVDKWTPARLSGLKVWMDASNASAITKDGSDFVSSWVSNKTPGTYAFTQGTGANQPKWYSSGFGTNSKPYIDFDGTNDSLYISGQGLLEDNEGTLFFAATSSDVTRANNFGIFCSTDAASNIKWFSGAILSSAGAGYCAVSWNTGTGSSSAYGNTTTQGSNNTPMLTMVKSNGSSYTINVNAVSQTVGGTNTGIWFSDITLRDNLIIGAAFKSISNIFFKGRIAEIIYSSSQLTSTEIDYCERYLNRKYGIY